MYPWWGKEFATKRSFPFFVSYKEDVDIIPLGIFPKTSRPSQASHRSSIFKIPFLLVLDWFLAWGHPYGGHGIMKQGMFKVYPVSSPQAPFLIPFISKVHPGDWWSQGTKPNYPLHWRVLFDLLLWDVIYIIYICSWESWLVTCTMGWRGDLVSTSIFSFVHLAKDHDHDKIGPLNMFNLH